MKDSKNFLGLFLEKETEEKTMQEPDYQVLRWYASPISHSEAHGTTEGICFVVPHKAPSAGGLPGRGPAPEGKPGPAFLGSLSTAP